MRESIQDYWDKFKSFFSDILSNDRAFLATLLIVIAVTSFGLGRLAERAVLQTPVKSHSSSIVFTGPSLKTEETASVEVSSEKEQYVASKSGTKYHYPWCPGAKQMKEENKIYFDSRPAAEAAGYTPAANCKGL